MTNMDIYNYIPEFYDNKGNPWMRALIGLLTMIALMIIVLIIFKLLGI